MGQLSAPSTGMMRKVSVAGAEQLVAHRAGLCHQRLCLGSQKMSQSGLRLKCSRGEGEGEGLTTGGGYRTPAPLARSKSNGELPDYLPILDEK